MKIDRSLVMHVAGLARLELSESEIGHYETQLSRILDYVKVLEGVASTRPRPLDPAPTGKPSALERPDVVRPSLPNEIALASAPEQRDGAFQVPKIIE